MRNINNKITMWLAGLLMSPMLLSATPQKSNPVLTWMMENIIFLMAGAVILGALLSAVSMMNALFDRKQREILASKGIEMVDTKSKEPSFLDSWWKKLSGLRPISRESDIDMGHDYDGIRELDNKLPPWWLYLFYFTIAFAAVYLYVYQFSDIGMSSHEEYAAQMEIADQQHVDYLFKMANDVNENNVVVVDDAARLANGKDIFTRNCVACHGAAGEGGVGPNFTDQYWIHGGRINDLFTTIKYGVPEKGMISWMTQLNPSSMQDVASYILSLQGTNPPNQKKAEGKLYVPEEEG